MRLFLAFILMVFVSTANAYAATLKFAQLTDIHLSVNSQSSGSRDLSSSVKNLEKAIIRINEDDSIEFVLITGDVINSSDEQELNKFLEIISQINKPYYIVMGNHDVHSIGGLTKNYFMSKVAEINPNQTTAQNFQFSPRKGITFIGLDTTASRFPSAHGYITEKTALWLDKALTKNKNNKVFIFQHEPLLAPIDKPTHSMISPETYTNVLAKHKNVAAIISGHYHDDRIVTDEQGIMHIVSPALFENPPKYRIIEIDYTNVLFSQPQIHEIKTENCLVL